MRFADFEVRKTATARRTLHPVWNEDFRFEVGDDSVIQNEPLELKVVDSDVITADDIIGVVFIDLNPLLTSAWDDSMAGSAAAHQAGTGAAQGQSGYAAGSATAGQISGWVPIVDTLLGVRGEINIQVRLQFFGDSNPFRDSSAGVQFFCSPSLIGSLPPGVSGSGSRGAPTGARRTLGRSGPEGDAGPGNGTLSRTGSETGVVSPSNSDDGFFVGQTIYGPGSYSYRVAQVLGFVELLDWNDDPEYHWADTFRTPRFSNESRQLLLFRLSGHIRRQLGKKVAAMGGNAVVGFRQYLDLEKDERIITYRAQGTAVVLVAAQPVIPVQLAPLRPGNNNGETGGATISQPSATKHARTTSVPSVKNGVLGMAELVPSEGRGNGGEQISGTPLPSKDRSLNRPPEKLKMPPFTEPTTVDDARSPGEVPLPTGSSSAPQILAPSGQLRPSTPVTAISNPPLAVSSAFRLPAPVNGGPSLFHPQKLRHFSSDQRLITTTRFPSFAVTSIGGLVTARSVKMIEADDDEDEVRDTWWNELRDEVENHARMLGCSFVLGYTETTTIDDDLYVLTASGTAANLDLSQLTSTEMDLDALGASSAYSGAPGLSSGIRSGSSSPVLEDAASLNTDRPNGSTYRRSSINGDSVVREATNASSSAFIRRRKQRRKKPCSICHISYDRHSTPFPMSFTKCGRCGRRYVPEMILATMEPPAELETLPDTVLIEAHVCRQKKRAERELNAEIVSDALPFVQYDIHRQLIYKLKIYGMNAIFGLKFQLSVGDSLIVATAVGTGMYLKALPLPAPLKIARNLGVLDEEDRKLLEIQDRIVQLSETNRRGIEAELQRSLAAAASARAARNLEAGDREATTGGIAHEDTATYDGTAESDSDSDSGSEGGTRRRRGSLGSDDEGDPRTVPVVQSSVIVQIDDDTDEDLVSFARKCELLSRQLTVWTADGCPS